jgi:hypothetical protein
MQPNTLTRLDTKVKFVLKMLEKMHAAFETICKLGFGSESKSEKNLFGFTTLPKTTILAKRNALQV